MPALTNYQSRAGQRVEQAPEIQAPATQLAAAQLGNLSQRLEQFSNTMFQAQEQVVANQAVDDALNDSAQGKPFHKEAVYTAYGKAYNNTLSATYASNADIAINQKSLELAMEHENNPVGYSEAMNEYVSELSRNSPTPELNTVIGLSGQKVKNATFGKLAIAENNRIKAASVRTFQEEWNLNLAQVINLKAQGNFADADVLEKKNMTHLGTLVADGLIQESYAVDLINDSKFEVTYGTSMETMKGLLQEPSLDNAKKYLDAATFENRSDMDINENTKHQDDLTKMFNNAVKSRKADEANFKEEANLAISKVNEILAVNKTPPTALMKEAQKLAPYASLSKQDSLQTSMDAYNIIKKYDSMSLPEQEAELARFKSSPEMSNVDVAVMGAIEKSIAKRKTQAKKDPQSLSVVEGIGAPINPIGTAGGIQGIVSELPNRANNQTRNILEYGKGATQLFTDSEATEWSNLLEDVNTPMSEKIAFAQAIYDTVPDRANAVFNQLRKKGALLYSYAATLAGEGKPEVAKGVLRGQELLKAAGPQDYIKEFRTSLLGKIGNAMIRSNPEDMEALVDSSLAYSLNLAEQKGDITNLKGLSERQAINDLTNGMYKRNKQDFFLPATASKDNFDEWVDEKLTASDFSDVAGMTPEQALTFTRGERVRITSVGTNKYALYDSLGRVLQKTDGTPLILEY